MRLIESLGAGSQCEPDPPCLASPDGTTGVVAKEYIWLPGAGYAGTDLPIGVVDVAGSATPELLYVHADHLGRPIRLTGPAKVTAWAVEWLPWGGVHSITGSETLNARFPGQWFQVESGLHYNWHRHYDPSIGRYTQPDPLGFVDGPSLYAYARNAPGEFVDPDGRQVALPFPVLVPPAIYCAAYPEKCSKLVEQCVAIFKRTFGGGGGGGGDDDRCKEVRKNCISMCTDKHVGRGRLYDLDGSKFRGCLQECLRINGC